MAVKIVLVDNFDSFTLNIAQYLYEVTGTRPVVLPNTTSYGDLPLAGAGAVVLSPGPGRPSRAADFGVCREVLARCGLPILGVCLGHQGIAEHFGARTVRAPEPAHGIVDSVRHTGTGLFSGLPGDLPVVRYHSLVVTDLPDDLERTAWTGDGLVMAIAHRSRPIWGVQFHPESIETPHGRSILGNFVTMAGSHGRTPAWHPPGTGTAHAASARTAHPPEPSPPPHLAGAGTARGNGADPAHAAGTGTAPVPSSEPPHPAINGSVGRRPVDPPSGSGHSPAVVRAFRRAGGALRYRLEFRRIERPPAPMDLFRRRFAGLPYAFWLDSEGSDRPGSRYSLMGAGTGPGWVALRYDLASRRLTLTGEQTTAVVEGDVFTLLETLVDAVHVEPPECWPLPFTGGLVGYLGYELKALTIGDERYHPDEAAAWFLHSREFTVFDHHAGHALDCRLVALDDGRPAEREGAPPASPAEGGGVPTGGAGNLLPSPPADGRGRSAAADRTAAGRPPVGTGSGRGFAPGAVPEPLLGLRYRHDRYLSMIDRARSLIVEGETYEVCLTNQARLAGVGDGLSAYGRMRRVSPVPYGAYLRCGDVEVLSSSPETFLRVDTAGYAESRPIKGTRSRGGTAEQDAALREELRRSEKDRAENLMIVDLVRHDLNGVCEPGSVHVPDAFAVESYSSVHQLVSTIRGRLRRGVPAMAAVRACFPGGSMTGAPKKRTMEIIDELEGAPRGIYSGALGWLSFSGALDLSIVIRTAVLRAGAATFGIGGAITARSDPEDEFTETLVKASVPYFGLRGWQDHPPGWRHAPHQRMSPPDGSGDPGTGAAWVVGSVTRPPGRSCPPGSRTTEVWVPPPHNCHTGDT